MGRAGRQDRLRRSRASPTTPGAKITHHVAPGEHIGTLSRPAPLPMRRACPELGRRRGLIVRAARLRAGMSQVELAQRAER